VIRTCFWGSSYVAPGKVMLNMRDYGGRAPQYLLQKNGGSEVAIVRYILKLLLSYLSTYHS